MIRLENLYACDFETNKEYEVCTWGCKSNDNYFAGVGLDSFMKWLKTITTNSYIFFHNGSNFDFQFILPAFHRYGYKPHFRENKKVRKVFESSKYKEDNISEGKLQAGQYEYLTDGNKKIFQMKVGLKKYKGKSQTITFRDSALLIPQKLKQYGQTLNKHYKTDRFTKLEEDYDNIKTYPSLEEFQKDTQSYEYLKRDCEILFEMLKVIDEYLPFNSWKMTAAGTAYNEWKKMFALKIIRESGEWTEHIPSKSKGDFKLYSHKSNPGKILKLGQVADKILQDWFPLEWQDTFNSKTYYFGGLTHLNPDYKGIYLKDELEVSSFDVNSSYPYSLVNTMIPYGFPFKKATKDSWNLYEIKARTDLVNEFGLPFIPRETGTAYLYETTIKKGRTIRICSTEYEHFKKYYKGKFEAKVTLSLKCRKGDFFFGDYVNHYSKKKIEAGRDGDVVMVTISKMFLNSLYGKFGSNVEIESKIYNPEIEDMENEKVLMEAGFFLPVAIATTASSRMLLVDAVGNNYKYFVYCDTDSIYCMSKHVNKFNIVTDLFELGKWKQETHQFQAIFRRAKQYATWKEDEGKNTVKIALASFKLPSNYVFNYEDFILGKIIDNQIKSHKEAGKGVRLENIEKEIPPIWHYETFECDWFYTKKEKGVKLEESQRIKYMNDYEKQREKLKNLVQDRFS